MKILLRIIGYFGVSLVAITIGIAYGYVFGLGMLGIILVFVALIEALIKYG